MQKSKPFLIINFGKMNIIRQNEIINCLLINQIPKLI